MTDPRDPRWMDVKAARDFLHSPGGSAEYRKLRGAKRGDAAIIAEFLNRNLHRVEAVLVDLDRGGAATKKPSHLAATHAACRELVRQAQKAADYADALDRTVERGVMRHQWAREYRRSRRTGPAALRKAANRLTTLAYGLRLGHCSVCNDLMIRKRENRETCSARCRKRLSRSS